ncbi:MAG: type II secretion system protein [Rickettsiales bacterium]
MTADQPTRPTTAAFSLVEIAIVLTIIALIIGATTVGSSMIRQSKLQTIIADYGKYTAAYNQFLKQYGSAPGDITDATSYWGDDNANCADAAIANGNPGTCNGNGDGQVAGNETYRAWQQMVMATYINGSYTGLASGGATPGTNVPKSNLSPAGWSIAYKGATSANANEFDQDVGNSLVFGGPNGSAITQASVLTPADAKQIDTKADNGMPGTGKMIAQKTPAQPNCTDGGADAVATYLRTYKQAGCSPYMSLKQ